MALGRDLCRDSVTNQDEVRLAIRGIERELQQQLGAVIARAGNLDALTMQGCVECAATSPPCEGLWRFRELAAGRRPLISRCFRGWASPGLRASPE